MASLKIVGLCILAAVAYGIVHDQITSRVCVEYFTIGHPPIFGTDDPTLLGLGWGVIATWWMGLILGILLAAAARAGSREPFGPCDLVRPIGRLLAVMFVSAAAFGTIGYLAASAGLIGLNGPIADRVQADRHPRFLADLWAHSASYGVGFFGGLVVIARTASRRKRLR